MNTIKLARYYCIESKLSNVKSFDEIPGPIGIFGAGTFYKYLPLIGI